MNRKEFVQDCLTYAGASFLFPILVQSCKSIAYVPHTLQSDRMVIKKSELIEQPFVLVKPAQLPAPIYLVRLNNGEYSAVLLRCTHRACEVRPGARELQCPCHGSVFSNAGEVLEGPAERPLRRFEVSSDDENIYIR